MHIYTPPTIEHMLFKFNEITSDAISDNHKTVADTITHAVLSGVVNNTRMFAYAENETINNEMLLSTFEHTFGNNLGIIDKHIRGNMMGSNSLSRLVGVSAAREHTIPRYKDWICGVLMAIRQLKFTLTAGSTQTPQHAEVMEMLSTFDTASMHPGLRTAVTYASAPGVIEVMMGSSNSPKLKEIANNLFAVHMFILSDPNFRPLPHLDRNWDEANKKFRDIPVKIIDTLIDDLNVVAIGVANMRIR